MFQCRQYYPKYKCPSDPIYLLSLNNLTRTLNVPSIESRFCCRLETSKRFQSLVLSWLHSNSAAEPSTVPACWQHTHSFTYFRYTNKPFDFPIIYFSVSEMAKTYGEKPIIFSFEENGEEYMIGSEVRELMT